MTGPALRVYLQVIVAVGALVLLHSLAALLHTPHPVAWFVFATLAVVTGSFTISVAPAEASMTVSDTFFIGSALLFGPAPATVALAVDSLVLSWRKRHSWRRIAFNTV